MVFRIPECNSGNLAARRILKSNSYLPLFRILSFPNPLTKKSFTQREKDYQIKDTLKTFDDFKNKQKSVLSNVLRYVKLYHVLKVYSRPYNLK